MPVIKLDSTWVAGYLKFRDKATAKIVGGFSSNGPVQGVTKVDLDAQNVSLLAATLLSGFAVHTSVTGAGTLTVDTGANLDTAFPEWQVGEVMSCFYLNDGTQTVTLTGAAGTTALAAQTIATLQGRMIRFLKTGVGTYDVWAD